MKNCHVWKWIYFVNIVLICIGFLAYLSPYTAPERSIAITILGLVFPIMFLLILGFGLLWLFVRPRRAIGSFVFILVSLVVFPQVFTFNVATLDLCDRPLTVVTYNMQFTSSVLSLNSVARTRGNVDMSHLVKEYMDVDVLCVQEMGERSKDFILDNIDALNYYNINGTTVAIFTPHEIVGQGRLDIGSNKANVGIWIDVLICGDTLRIYNTHMESNRSEIGTPVVIDQNIQEHIGIMEYVGILGNYKYFTTERCHQAKVIKNHANRSGKRYIVAGDTNDTPMSRIYNILSDGMTDTWIGYGSGFGSTHDSWIPGMRIDQILVDSHFRVCSYEVVPNDFSDHHLVKAVICL